MHPIPISMRSSTHSRSPLLPLASLGGLHLDTALAHLIPVRAQSRAAALRVALHHSTLRIVVRIREEFLEELVHGRVATGIGILVRGDGFVGAEDLFGDAVPILAGFTGLRGWGCGRRYEGICKYCGIAHTIAVSSANR